MKITAFIGSPNKNGSVSRITNKICESAKNHDIKIYHLYDLEMKGCLACMACKKDDNFKYCVQKDDMTEIYKRIEETDYIIIGTPIYFGHMTGPTKILLDRFFAFFNSDYKLKINKKKFITITTSGASIETFCEPLSDFFKEWFEKFFKMEIIEQINVGGFDAKNPVISELDMIMERAEKLGKNL